MTCRRNALVLCILLVTTLAVASLPSAQADHPEEETWLSVHDTEGGPDSDQTGRSVDCLFWVKGYDLPYGNGTLTALTTGSFGARTEDFGEWTGTANGDGTYSLEAGPFEILRSGDHWTVIAEMFDENDGSHAVFSPSFTYGYCDSEDDETSIAPPPDCPGDVIIEATADGNRLTWEMSSEHDGAFNVYRDGEFLSFVGGMERSYLDSDVEDGENYDYRVTATHGPRESGECPTVSVTAVPFFGGAIGIALAALGSVGVAAMFLRRK